MSQDFEIIFNDTTDLFYREKTENPIAQNYRLLDAPITRYSIGFVRSIFGQPGLNSDWDWSKTWNENLSALPQDRLLNIARISTAIYFPGAVILYTFLTKKLFPKNLLVIFSSCILFSLNSLFLLHTRRAMAESSMIFFLLLSIYLFENLSKKSIFLSAVPIGLAINAKQNLLFLILVGIVLIIYYFKNNFKKLVLQLFFYGFIIFLIFLILNPITWKQPFKVLPLMFTTRSELSLNQELSLQSVSPEYIVDNFPSKFTALVGQLFVLPPTPQEIANYESNLQPSIDNYFLNIFHRGVFRNILSGVFILLIVLFGLMRSIYVFSWKHKIIYCLSFFLFISEILIVLKIPFQRYYLPGLPFIILFFLIGFFQIFNLIRKNINILRQKSKFVDNI